VARPQESGSTVVRGGPWCRKVLPEEDVCELGDCAGCASRAAVRALAKRRPAGSLTAHLECRSYASAPNVVLARGSWAPAGSAKLPIINPPAPRKSGRSRTSGASGVSGHQHRLQRGLAYGDKGYEKNKWGKRPVAARAQHKRTLRLKNRWGGGTGDTCSWLHMFRRLSHSLKPQNTGAASIWNTLGVQNQANPCGILFSPCLLPRSVTC
jgi:hypothetical protein